MHADMKMLQLFNTHVVSNILVKGCAGMFLWGPLIQVQANSGAKDNFCQNQMTESRNILILKMLNV